MIRDIYLEWELVRDALLPALAMCDGTHNEDDIILMLRAGKMKLWRAGSSGMITEEVAYPRFRAINIFIAGGSLKELMPLKEQLIVHAASLGCKRITALFAHSGWTAFWGDEFKTIGSASYKEL